MTPRTLSIALLATLATLVVPAVAAAEYLVPEGNSAVTQYTEGFPTGGGEKKTEGGKHVTPNKALGAGNAKKLQDHGPEGAAVAEVAAETAPPPAPSPTPAPASDSGADDSKRNQGDGGNGGKHTQGEQKQKPRQDSKQGGESGATAPPAQGGDGPSGSSGAGEVLGAATGASSGSVGLLLPLLIVAAVVWGALFFWRQRRHPNDPAASRS